MAAYMQARDSITAEIFHWEVDAPDWTGTHYPGPNSMQDVSVLSFGPGGPTDEVGGAVSFAAVKAALALANSAISFNSREVTNLGAPFSPTSAARKADVTALLGGTSGVDVGSAAAVGVSAFAARSDHAHRITEATLRAAFGTLAGAVTYNNQSISGVNTLSLTTIGLDVGGAINFGASVFAQISGPNFLIGNSTSLLTDIRSGQQTRLVVNGTPRFAAVVGGVVTSGLTNVFDATQAGPLFGQAAPATNIVGGGVWFTGQGGGPGNNAGGQPWLANGAPAGTGLRKGAIVGLRSSAGVLQPMIECCEVATGVLLTAIGAHAALGAETNPGVSVIQVAESGAFGTSNPPAGQVYVRITATRFEVKDSTGTVRGVTLT